MKESKLNKEICKELQKVAISLIDTCKFELKKDKGYYTTGELLKLRNESPWIIMGKIESDYEVTVSSGPFKCSFCIGSVFLFLSKFEKISGTKESIFVINEDQTADGLQLSVMAGNLPANVTKERVTHFARNGNDIVNRYIYLTKVSDVAYVKYINEIGCFDAYLKINRDLYFVGRTDIEHAKTITADCMMKLYIDKIESSGYFSLIDIEIIKNIMPDRLDEANECREECLKIREKEKKEFIRLSAEEREKRKAESIIENKEKKEVSKANKIEKENKSRVDKILTKLVQYDGGTMTTKEYLNELKNKGYTPNISEKSSIKYNRVKYNSMGYEDQCDYERKLNIKVPLYMAENSDGVFYELKKLEYEYFKSLFSEINEENVTVSVAPEAESANITAPCIVAPICQKCNLYEQPDERVPAEKIICIECKPEDIPYYLYFIDNVPGTIESTPAQVSIDAPAASPPYRPPKKIDATVWFDAPGVPCWRITDKGLYYLVA